MNNDTYAEFLVKRKPPIYVYAIKAVMIFLCIIGLFLSITTAFGVIILVIIGGATYFVFQTQNLEFEYLVINDQINIDKILGQSRRKKAWESTMEEIQIVAPSDSYLLKDYERPGTKTLNYSSQIPNAKTYTIIQQKAGNTTKIIFEPNDKILHCMRQRSPRKVIQ